MNCLHHLLGRPKNWLPALLLIVSIAGSLAADEPARLDPAAPRPKPITPPTSEAIDRAITRGIDFLLVRQEKNGAWGSARTTKGYNIFAPAPGSHHAFRAAVTGLGISALIESGDARPEVSASLDRAEAWLFEHLPSVRRADAETLYNVWGHAYAIQALVRMAGRHKDDAEKQQRIKSLIEQQIELLERYECIGGGWCYYDLEAHTKQPGDPSFCFVTATVLVALAEARDLGITIPRRPVDKGMESIRRQRKSDFSYLYGGHHKYRPMYDINRPGGSLGRSQACNLAMYVWHDPKTTLPVMRTWLDRLFAQNLWLDIGRKRPIVHESWMHVSGYFYYYGHYYAALCIEQLDPSERPHYQQHLAHILLERQEKNGSWWDYPMYDYHEQYGTAFAIMSLVDCRPDESEKK
ncbi:MAG: terpene cyclase/mutase family protein [Pirellulales bacterium]|nr:terpene cyclase/mutase family protein [Pirellulales bacterium]